MAFNIDELTPEQIHKGMTCKSLEEFKAFVKEQGFDLNDDEAQASFEEMYAIELSDEELDAVAGGNWATECFTWSCAEDTGRSGDTVRRRKRK